MIFSIFHWKNTCSHLCFTSLNLNVEHNVFYFPLEIHVLIFVSPFPAWSLFIKKEYGVMVWWIRNIKTYDPAYCLLLIKISIDLLACHPQPRYLFGTDKCFVLTCFLSPIILVQILPIIYLHILYLHGSVNNTDLRLSA